MAVQAGLVNTQIPMSAKTANIDMVGNAFKGYSMRGQMAEQEHQVQAINREDQDRASLKSYLESGGDLNTPMGVDKALSELKGKTSPDMYMKLTQHADQVKKNDIGMRKSIAEMDADKLDLYNKQLERTITYLAQPLQVYDSAIPAKGQQQALVEFNEARNKVLASAAQMKDATGNPVYPPEILQQLAQADPMHLKSILSTTKYQKDLVDQRFKESQITRNQALADYDTARARAVEEGRGPGGSKSEIEKIEHDVQMGYITREQADRMKEGIVAKKASPADVTTMTPEAVHNAAMDHYLNGSLPARMSARERAMVLNESANIAKENGDDAEAVSIRQSANKANRVALNDLSKREALTATFERDADKRLGLILEMSKKVDQSGIPVLNRWINAGKANIAGDKDVNTFNSAMISAQAELAKVLSGALGNAGVSDAARAEAAQIINKYMTPEQIEDLVPNIRRELRFKLDAFREEKNRIKSEMSTPKSQRKQEEDSKISPEKQSMLDQDRVGILLDEYRAAKDKVKKFDPRSPDTADAYSRAGGDILALKRELSLLGVKDPDSELSKRATAPAPQPRPAAPVAAAKPPQQAASVPVKNARGWALHVDAKGNRAYVSPDGKSFEEVK